MKPPEERSQRDPQSSSVDRDREFAQGLEEVERSLIALKERYTQVQQDQARQAELQHRYEEVRQDKRSRRSQELQAELRRIKQEVEVLEVNLESSLFSWSSLKEPFWMAVRFGGIGIGIGWLLKYIAGN